MATTELDTLVTRFTGDNRQYLQTLDQLEARTTQTTSKLTSSLGHIGTAWAAVGSGAAVATAGLAAYAIAATAASVANRRLIEESGILAAKQQQVNQAWQQAKMSYASGSIKGGGLDIGLNRSIALAQSTSSLSNLAGQIYGEVKGSRIGDVHSMGDSAALDWAKSWQNIIGQANKSSLPGVFKGTRADDSWATYLARISDNTQGTAFFNEDLAKNPWDFNKSLNTPRVKDSYGGSEGYYHDFHPLGDAFDSVRQYQQREVRMRRSEEQQRIIQSNPFGGMLDASDKYREQAGMNSIDRSVDNARRALVENTQQPGASSGAFSWMGGSFGGGSVSGSNSYLAPFGPGQAGVDSALSQHLGNLQSAAGTNAVQPLREEQSRLMLSLATSIEKAAHATSVLAKEQEGLSKATAEANTNLEEENAYLKLRDTTQKSFQQFVKTNLTATKYDNNGNVVDLGTSLSSDQASYQSRRLQLKMQGLSTAQVNQQMATESGNNATQFEVQHEQAMIGAREAAASRVGTHLGELNKSAAYMSSHRDYATMTTQQRASRDDIYSAGGDTSTKLRQLELAEKQEKAESKIWEDLQKQKQATEDNLKSAKEYTAEIEKQIGMHGKSAYDRERSRITGVGANGQQLFKDDYQRDKALQRVGELEALDKRNAKLDMGNKLIESQETAQEKYNREVKVLKDLYQSGSIVSKEDASINGMTQEGLAARTVRRKLKEMDKELDQSPSGKALGVARTPSMGYGYGTATTAAMGQYSRDENLLSQARTARIAEAASNVMAGGFGNGIGGVNTNVAASKATIPAALLEKQAQLKKDLYRAQGELIEAQHGANLSDSSPSAVDRAKKRLDRIKGMSDSTDAEVQDKGLKREGNISGPDPIPAKPLDDKANELLGKIAIATETLSRRDTVTLEASGIG